MQNAYDSTSDQWRLSLWDRSYMHDGGVLYSLNDRDIFGHGGRRRPPVNAAARVEFSLYRTHGIGGQPAPTILPVSEFDEYVVALAHEVSEKQLGDILRVTTDRGVAFYVVKNVDLAMDYAPAIGINENQPVERYSMKSRAWLPIENNPTMSR